MPIVTALRAAASAGRRGPLLDFECSAPPPAPPEDPWPFGGALGGGLGPRSLALELLAGLEGEVVAEHGEEVGGGGAGLRAELDPPPPSRPPYLFPSHLLSLIPLII